MSNPGLTKTYAAEAAIAPYRFVKWGTGERAVIQSAAATDAHVGISDSLGRTTAGRVDVYRGGLVEVEYGGNVAAGDPLTADANGMAVAAAPAPGATVRIIGHAEVAGVAGDIGLVMLAPSHLQG